MMLATFVESRLREALGIIGADTSTTLVFEVPKQSGQGHLSSTVAMSLAKQLKRAPKQLAEELVQAFGLHVPFVQRVEVAGPGFINFTFTTEAYHTLLRSMAKQGNAIGTSQVGKGKHVNVEYVSANPTGPLHAGHGRNCALGDTISNMFAACGYEVTREYYFNNAGNQMNNLAISIFARVQHKLGNEQFPFPENGYHGDYIYTIAEDIVANVHNEFNTLSEKEQVEFCKKAGEKWCFASIVKTLTTLNIKHDIYFNEDTLYSDGKVEATISSLREKGLVYEKDGATWLALTELGNPQDKVIVKSTGEATYRLPDIAYHREKLLRGYDIVVDIFGADHIGTIPDVLAGVRALGFETNRVQTVIHQMVTFFENGEVVKFSKRSGKSLTLDELIEEVSADVVRFFFVMRAAGTHLDFDINLAREESDKNPVFYLQYAHARICSILRKAKEQNIAVTADTMLDSLEHPTEIALISLLSRMQYTLERATQQLEPHTIAEYLREVAAHYHQFYHDCRILGTEEKLQQARLLLATTTQRALQNGLKILGVQAPETM